ncbi:MAG: hypothetical protein OEM23_07010, partial [Gemmatimonadota bacterium]|nr:hypothetical protein [Gemmatimonadota bacterium]
MKQTPGAGGLGAFPLVFRTRILLLIAFLVMLNQPGEHDGRVHSRTIGSIDVSQRPAGKYPEAHSSASSEDALQHA